MITHCDKLKPLKGEVWRYYDGCRLPDGTGTKWVIWSSDDRTPIDSPRFLIVYAAGCKWCRKFWGWTYDLPKAAKTARAMARKGCPHCEKRLKPRVYKKLQKYLAKKVDG